MSSLELGVWLLSSGAVSWACLFSSDGPGKYTYLGNGARKHSRWLPRLRSGFWFPYASSEQAAT
ncbi:MAG TPA: hypothetical protein VF881_03350 [Polyangiaceae bacterium]